MVSSRLLASACCSSAARECRRGVGETVYHGLHSTVAEFRIGDARLPSSTTSNESDKMGVGDNASVVEGMNAISWILRRGHMRDAGARRVVERLAELMEGALVSCALSSFGSWWSFSATSSTECMMSLVR